MNYTYNEGISVCSWTYYLGVVTSWLCKESFPFQKTVNSEYLLKNSIYNSFPETPKAFLPKNQTKPKIIQEETEIWVWAASQQAATTSLGPNLAPAVFGFKTQREGRGRLNMVCGRETKPSIPNRALFPPLRPLRGRLQLLQKSNLGMPEKHQSDSPRV